MLEMRRLALPDIIEIRPKRHGDARGYFSETYSSRAFSDAGIDIAWVQDNQSFSGERSTLRGLHYQEPPFAQDKLVRVLRGRILDVAVDIRQGSPSFGRWAGLEVSSEAFNQVFVPAGFAHGFLTLEPDTEVFYKVSAPYSPEHDRSIRWDDPEIGIDWRLGGAHPVLSPKDSAGLLLSQIETVFRYDGARS